MVFFERNMHGSRETKEQGLPLRVKMHQKLQEHQEDHIFSNAYPTQPKYIREKQHLEF